MKKQLPTLKVKVQVETDYRRFVRTDENRVVECDSRHYRKILASMGKYGFIPAYPIHVRTSGNKFEIVDGQHRFAAAKELGLPFYFIVLNNGEISIPEINDTQKGWNIGDYIGSFSERGNAQYVQLQSVMERYHLPTMVAIAAMRGNYSKGVKAVKSGSFEVKNADLTEKLGSAIASLRTISKVANHSTFILAMLRCLRVRQFDINHFLSKCKRNPGLIMYQPNLEEFTRMFERIYNHNMRSPIPLSHLVEMEMRKRCGREVNKPLSAN